jgi:NADPH2:quinone reductase
MTDLFYGNHRVAGFHFGQAISHQPSSVLSAVPELTEILSREEIEVIVDWTFPLEKASEAHQFIEDRKGRGKVVLVSS